MFIQIAKNKSMRQKDIIGVFDLDTSTISAVTKNFLIKAEKNNKITGTNTLPKSFILTDNKIYLSSNMTAHIYKSAGIKQRLSTT